MSKKLLGVFAFLILSITFVRVSYAQEDSTGIVPVDQAQPIEIQELQEEPVQTREERVRDLIYREVMAYESAKAKYISVLQNPSDEKSDDYKLNAILISARYHKLINLYYEYLLKIEKSFAESDEGFEVIIPDDELNQIEQKITAVSAAVYDFDSTIDIILGVGITEAELPALSPEIVDNSARVKLQLDGIKTDLLNLVNMVE